MPNPDLDNLPHRLVDELVDRYPGCMRVFARHGMACIGCPMARFETVGEVADAYHLDVDAFVRELGAIAAAGDNPSPLT